MKVILIGKNYVIMKQLKNKQELKVILHRLVMEIHYIMPSRIFIVMELQPKDVFHQLVIILGVLILLLNLVKRWVIIIKKVIYLHVNNWLEMTMMNVWMVL